MLLGIDTEIKTLFSESGELGTWGDQGRPVRASCLSCAALAQGVGTQPVCAWPGIRPHLLRSLPGFPRDPLHLGWVRS